MLSPSQLCSSTSPNVTARNKRNLSICTGTNCAGRAPSSVSGFVVFSVDVAARKQQNLVLTPTRVTGHRWQALVACAAHCVGNALWVAQEQIGVDPQEVDRPSRPSLGRLLIFSSAVASSCSWLQSDKSVSLELLLTDQVVYALV